MTAKFLGWDIQDGLPQGRPFMYVDIPYCPTGFSGAWSESEWGADREGTGTFPLNREVLYGI